MSNAFDQVIDRRGSHSIKWEPYALEKLFGNPDLLPLWVADMDFKSPKPVVEAMVKRAEHGIYGYSSPSAKFYEVLNRWSKIRNGWEIDTDWMAFVPGVIPAVNYALQAFCQNGDEVIVQNPVYQMFEDVIKVNDLKLVYNPLKYSEGNYQMDFEDLEAKLKSPQAKVFILCSPHNPVGRVWTLEELKRIGDLCLENDVFVIADEIHSDLILKGHKHIPFASISEAFSKNSMTCLSPTKTFNLAGLQVSVSVIEDSAKRRLFKHVMHKCGVMHPNPMGIVAWEAAYESGDVWLQDLMTYVGENFDYLDQYLKSEIPVLKMVKPQGTYLAWVDFRGLGLEANELNKWLKEKLGLALGAGMVYGPGGEGFMRINVACPKETLKQALEILKQGVGQLDV